MTEEDRQLAGLVGLAWEARGWPDFRQKSEAIVEWHDRRHIRAYEWKQRHTAQVLEVLRETVPSQGGRSLAETF